MNMAQRTKAITASDEARQLLAEAFVWDMTLPWQPAQFDRVTLPRFHRAGFDAINLTVGTHGSFEDIVRWIARLNRYVRSQTETMVQCKSVADLERARADGKLGLVYHLQESIHFERNIELVEFFYDLGIRHALLAYNSKNYVGDGCSERTDAGLSRWGIELVQEMNRVGMIVCGTHTGYRTTMDAMEVTTAPFIFSHANSHAVYPHYRNIKDDQIKACAATGGVIGINGLGEFLDDHEATSRSIFRHIDHVAQLVGPQHVGIGLDFVKDEPEFWEMVRDMSYMWPPNAGQERTHSHFAQPEQVVELVDLMLGAGYSRDDIFGVLGGNFRRVASQVWK